MLVELSNDIWINVNKIKFMHKSPNSEGYDIYFDGNSDYINLNEEDFRALWKILNMKVCFEK